MDAPVNSVYKKNSHTTIQLEYLKYKRLLLNTKARQEIKMRGNCLPSRRVSSAIAEPLFCHVAVNHTSWIMYSTVAKQSQLENINIFLLNLVSYFHLENSQISRN